MSEKERRNMNKFIFMGLAALNCCCSNVTDPTLVAAATQPATPPVKESHVEIRQVEVTLLGKTSDLKGMQWPDDPPEQAELRRSTWIEEPCDLTVRLPSGKVLKLRTRPILIVSRIWPTHVIGSIDAPPQGGRASLREKAEEVERLLDQWQIVSNEPLRNELNEWKRQDYAGTGIGGQLRIGIALDEQTYLSFRVTSGGPDQGGWHLVVEIEAMAEEMQRIKQGVKTESP
jgi:hypothetical protein